MALVAIVPVIFYTFIAGLGVAAVRSTIMVLSFLLALLLDREKDLEYFGFLQAWPYKSWVEEQPRWKRKALAYVGGSLLTSTAAILGTGPLVGYYFNRVSLVGFASNLLLVPLMGFANTLLSLLAALLVFLSQPLAFLFWAGLGKVNG